MCRTQRQYMCKLAAAGKARLKTRLSLLSKEHVLPSVCVDIWGENGVSLLGVTVNFVDTGFTAREGMLGGTCATHV